MFEIRWNLLHYEKLELSAKNEKDWILKRSSLPEISCKANPSSNGWLGGAVALSKNVGAGFIRDFHLQKYFFSSRIICQFQSQPYRLRKGGRNIVWKFVPPFKIEHFMCHILLSMSNDGRRWHSNALLKIHISRPELPKLSSAIFNN